MSASGGHTALAPLINGVRLEMIERGTGAPLLFLHPEIGIDPRAPFLDLLAGKRRVLTPTHPGFGNAEVPKGVSTIDDLSYFYLDVLDALDLNNVVIVGVSLGAWIAAAIAVKSTTRISHLVLANAVGIKVGDRETRDIVDIWAISDDKFAELAYFDSGLAKRDYKAMSDAEVRAAARNREAAARFAWSPYFHDPKLKGRLHRIDVPTLFLWGTADRIVSEAYGRAFCAAVPGARFETLDRAGHFPHLEQPAEFANRTLAFINSQPAEIRVAR